MSRMREALRTADFLCEMIARTNASAVLGDEHMAASRFREMVAFAVERRPVIQSAIAAQEQAAKALNLPQGRQPVRVLCSIGLPSGEHPDASNTHAANPELPVPTVA